MAWSTPLTAVANTPLTAAQWNASVRDNLNMTPAALATTAGSTFAGTGANAIAERIPAEANVATPETTTLTGYADLPSGTVGPSVTATTGPRALVIINARQENNSANASYAGFEVSGATTYAGGDSIAITTTLSSGLQVAGSRATLFAATPGSNTFKMNYRVGGGTGTFQSRRIVVMPF